MFARTAMLGYGMSVLVFLLWVLLPQLASAQSITGPSVFLNSSYGVRLPTGAALDANGNIYVYDVGDPQAIQKFRPSRAPEAQISIPNPQHNPLPGEGHLTEDPRTGLIIGLEEDGLLFAMDANLTVRQAWNLKAINWDESAIYDVQTDLVRSGSIPPSLTDFGRVYAVPVGTTTELWITANWVTIPFVMKMTVDTTTGRITAPKVMVSSSVTTAPNIQPGGIAVSGSGVVLTTLPVKLPTDAGIKEHAVVFLRSFEPGNPAGAPRILSTTPVGSVSIAADTAGNFYVSTGEVGSLLCGASGSGAIIVIPKTLASMKCFPIFNSIVETKDIVVNHAGSLGYLAVSTPSEIVQFSIEP
jgi:hypothetical protein